MVEEVSKGQHVLESDRLPDPCNDRAVPSVPRPPNRFLSIDRVFPVGKDGQRSTDINIDLIEEYLYEGGLISKECLLEMIARARVTLLEE